MAIVHRARQRPALHVVAVTVAMAAIMITRRVRTLTLRGVIIVAVEEGAEVARDHAGREQVHL
ncbi:hypothetical protein [Dyadobacter tibetensis]|uniref:hypothetical protein n=1 Tax=Dyadobacter tibetensis TaxID=1211851 RepID=UPI001E3CDE77|nr:hypothetical protein [Dyadobacter tibetensis]